MGPHVQEQVVLGLACIGTQVAWELTIFCVHTHMKLQTTLLPAHVRAQVTLVPAQLLVALVAVSVPHQVMLEAHVILQHDNVCAAVGAVLAMYGLLRICGMHAQTVDLQVVHR